MYKKNKLFEGVLLGLILLGMNTFAQQRIVSSKLELDDELSKISAGLSNNTTIILQDNVYNIGSTVVMDAAFDGITFRGCGEVFLNGGTVLNSNQFIPFSQISNPGFTLNDSNASSSIMVLDLNAIGINANELGSFNHHGYGFSDDFDTPAMLWLDGDKMEVARWPNREELMTTDDMIIPSKWEDLRDEMHGQLSYYEMLHGGTKKSTTDGPRFTIASAHNTRLTSWSYHQNSNEKIWLDGVLHSSWEWEYNQVASISSNEITLQNGGSSAPTMGTTDGRSVNTKTKVAHFYFENIPEELDAEGEYFIDRDNMLLYFYPPTGWENRKLTLSTLNDSMIQIQGANGITFENITFEAGLKNGITTDANSSNIVVQNCIVRNFNQWGIRILGENNLVDNVEVFNVGAGGVKLGLEQNSYVLQPENNLVTNSKFHDFAWDQKSQVPGVTLSGCGNKAIGNEFYNAPHFAIKYRQARRCESNNNYIHDLPNYHHFDGGAIYLGLGYNSQNRENKVLNNTLTHVPTNGIYLDNYTTGNFVEGNMFYDVGDATEGANYAAIYNHGGGQNTYKNNVAVDCPVMIKTGSYIVKQGNAYKYLNSWLDQAQNELALGSQNYIDFTNQFSNSNYATYLSYLNNLPSTVTTNLPSINTISAWNAVRDQWDEQGYLAMLDTNNTTGIVEWQEWRNYFLLRYQSSLIQNNLNLTYNVDKKFDSFTNLYSAYGQGDQKAFWEFSPYFERNENNTIIASLSNHVVLDNAYYDETETPTLFPSLVSNSELNVAAYQIISQLASTSDLSSDIALQLSMRGDLDQTVTYNCDASDLACTDIGIKRFKYNDDGSCGNLIRKDQNSSTMSYDIDLSSGTQSHFVTLDFVVESDGGSGLNGVSSSVSPTLNDEDILIFSKNPDNAFQFVYVDHKWETKSCSWSSNKRIRAQIEYTGNDINQLKKVQVIFNPYKKVKSELGLDYCTATINIDYLKSATPIANRQLLSEFNTGVYPNPTNGMITFSAEGLTMVQIFDPQGKLVKEISVSTDSITTDLDVLKQGVYLVNLNTISGTEKHLIVKQ